MSLSNNASLTFDGVRGAILNEEIRRKASGESSSFANITRGRAATKNVSMQSPEARAGRKKSLAFSVSVKGIKRLM